jgi:hypothetical protein
MFPPSVFYSRRIGRSPQTTIDAEFVSAPSETTILGAAKVTGRLRSGWSIGVLDALTDAERGRFVDGERSGRRQVEPMTNYFVSRAAKEIGSNSRLGFLFTSVNRRLPDELSNLRESAVTAGLDGYTFFGNRNWVFEWEASGTSVEGSTEAIALTQSSSSRYYQRPDASHVQFDPTRTSLSGWAGRAMLSKQTGEWRPNVQVQAYSPGYETNDAGFMQRTDFISSHALVQYVNERLTRRFRERQVWFGAWNNRNFDGDTLERGFFVDAFATTQSYWNYRAALFVSPEAYSDRLTRGGPVALIPMWWSSEASIGSDDRKKFFFEIEGNIDGSEDDSYVRGIGLELNYRPSSNLVVSLAPYYSRSHDYTQFVSAHADPTATGTFGNRYVFAELDQHTFELGTRVDWTLSSRLSFQLYMQPFVSAGDYHDYHSLSQARTADYEPYAATFSDPDFNFRSVRGSAVMRWEFRPGSALYIVWNENRADVAPIGDFRFRRDLRAIPNAPSHDVFLVKVSYWLPMG